jgi:hypothetical protein
VGVGVGQGHVALRLVGGGPPPGLVSLSCFD